MCRPRLRILLFCKPQSFRARRINFPCGQRAKALSTRTKACIVQFRTADLCGMVWCWTLRVKVLFPNTPSPLPSPTFQSNETQSGCDREATEDCTVVTPAAIADAWCKRHVSRVLDAMTCLVHKFHSCNKVMLHAFQLQTVNCMLSPSICLAVISDCIVLSKIARPTHE